MNEERIVVVWYFDSGVNFHPWYFDPLISNQEIGRGVKIPWIGGSINHWEGGQITMDRGVNIPWVGGSKYQG